jgi:hypothetical protein
MARLTIVFGVLLIALGVAGFVMTGSVHYTALIPCGFGLILVLCGSMASTEDSKKRMLWMHIAVTVGLLGFLGTIPGAIKAGELARGITIARPEAAVAQSAMCLLCMLFVAFCVRSFIAARRARLTV